MQQTELLQGTLQTIILKVLHDHGKMYGYEISQQVHRLSDGQLLLTEGALYPALHKMEAEGLLTAEVVTLGKRVRKYYTLTHDGDRQVQAKVVEFIQFFRVLSRVLDVQISG